MMLQESFISGKWLLEEKLLIGFQVSQNTAGANNAPSRSETVGKCDTTTNTGQFTRIDCNNSSTCNYDTDSNISAIGSDVVESIAVQDGAIYYDTDLNKEYVLYNNTWTEVWS